MPTSRSTTRNRPVELRSTDRGVCILSAPRYAQHVTSGILRYVCCDLGHCLRCDVMVWILNAKGKELISSVDEHGRNALHYAAASGHVKMTQHLLKIDDSIAHQIDQDGQTPLHLAAKNGRVSVMKILLNDHPDATKVLDKTKCNILHLAAQNGHLKTVLFILKLPEIEEMINWPDVNGNPLHMAAMNLHNSVVYFLSINMMVNIRATNNADKTAIALAETSRDHEKEFEKHLTKKALELAYVKRGLYPEDILENNRSNLGGSRSIDNANKGLQGKEIAQTLSVIATLIETFTFAAAFALPGGYKSDGPDQGTAALLRKSAFQAFVITDTIAMTSSMTAAVIVFWSFWRNVQE
ncbi:hypothetical protein Ddye_027285 [Dipteronia dyeriana]|uniref:PGG domain-containing protein n=1 Tax=Dipteronia dyeriana TaxID=168575 RepID=A0AAD9TPR4_9ROSI|nr:hypothetical protein Ddye_027285 [Dipteronia dyeriana]